MNATDTVCNRPLRNEGYVLVSCAAVLGTLAFLTVLMRLFVAVRQKSLGYDDLFACLAACMSIPNSIGLATSAKMGLGRDIWTLTPFEITRIQKVGVIRSPVRVTLTYHSGHIYLPELLLLVFRLPKTVFLVLLPPNFSFRTRTMVVLCRHSAVGWVCSRLWVRDDLCLLANFW